MKAFQPMGPDTPAMNGYYELPPRVLEDNDELAAWMSRAVAVAMRSPRKAAKKTGKKSAGTPRGGSARTRPLNAAARPAPTAHARLSGSMSAKCPVCGSCVSCACGCLST